MKGDEMVEVFTTIVVSMFIYDVFKFAVKVMIGAIVLHSQKGKV